MKQSTRLTALVLLSCMLASPLISCSKEDDVNIVDSESFEVQTDMISDPDDSQDGTDGTSHDTYPDSSESGTQAGSDTSAPSDTSASTDASTDSGASSVTGEHTPPASGEAPSVSPGTSSGNTPQTPQDTSGENRPSGSERPDDTLSNVPPVTFPEDPPADTPADTPSVTQNKIYVSYSSGKDSNSGKEAAKAVKTLEQAYKSAEALDGNSARIVLCDNYTLNGHFTEPAHQKNVTLTSEGGCITFSGAYRFILSGNTKFESVSINYKGTVNFVANYNYITFGKEVKLTNTSSGNGAYVVGGYQNPASNADTTKNSHIRIDSGNFYSVIGGSRQKASGGNELIFSGYHYIEINGGNIKTVYGGTTSNHTSKDAYITIRGGEINEICAAGEVTRSLSGDAVIDLIGGTVNLLNINNVYGDAIVSLSGTKLRSANVSYYNLDIKADAKKAGGAKLFIYSDGKFSENEVHNLAEHFDAAMTVSVYKSESNSAQKVMYVKGGASGNGTSPSDPSSITKALKALSEGGTVVVAGLTEMPGGITYTNSGKITITSKYGGVDYARQNDAALLFRNDFSLGGDTHFEHIELQSASSYKSIFAHNHKLTMGEGIVCLRLNEEANYLSVMGGSNKAQNNARTELTINSGTWQRVRGGTAAAASTNYTVDLTVNGGRFTEKLTLGSSLSHSGDIKAVINGGTFFGGIVASGIESSSYSFNSNVHLTLNGGIFYSAIAVSSSTAGTFSGSFNVNLNGGEFGHLVRLTGSEGLSGGMSSTLNSKVDLDAVQTGTYNFSNPVQGDGADPWLFYNNGYYYYIATAGSVLRLRRAANIGDLPYAETKIIYDPEDGHEWSKNLWSPEIHYYTDEQIGKGNGGWYCYVACDDGDNVNHRMYVIKCLDGNDLFGRWGNPVTGEVNVPQRIEAKDIPGFDDIWAAGQTDIIINGQLYMMYVTEACRGTVDFHQTINLVKMTNPWTIVGQSHVICKSEYDWEMKGHAVSQSTGKIWPKVVEGGTAVYGDDGSVYIIYSGSGYWTTFYSLGQLKYMGGDPLDIANWKKSPTPIFSKNGQINGCGHASYVTDTSGQRWICYHAYTGTDTKSGRDAFVEPYTVDSSGVTIGNGSKHPANLATVYTADINPMTLRQKSGGFTQVY